MDPRVDVASEDGGGAVGGERRRGGGGERKGMDDWKAEAARWGERRRQRSEWERGDAPGLGLGSRRGELKCEARLFSVDIFQHFYFRL